MEKQCLNNNNDLSVDIKRQPNSLGLIKNITAICFYWKNNLGINIAIQIKTVKFLIKTGEV